MEVGDLRDTLPMEEKELQRLLGILWDTKSNSLCFKVKINLSPPKKKFHAGPLSQGENSQRALRGRLHAVSTTYLQVQSLFDPIGLLAPVLL